MKVGDFNIFRSPSHFVIYDIPGTFLSIFPVIFEAGSTGKNNYESKRKNPLPPYQDYTSNRIETVLLYGHFKRDHTPVTDLFYQTEAGI